MLRGQREERGDAERDPGRHRLRLDPERDPGHHDDQAGGDVGVEEVVAQVPTELEDHLQAREVACRARTILYKTLVYIIPYLSNRPRCNLL